MSHRVRLLPSGREFVTEAQETLLEAALRHGVNIPYNCSGGSCGVCKARVVSGSTSAPRFHDYVFTAAERQQDYVLLCSVGAATDLTLEVQEVGEARQIPHQQLSTSVSQIERPGEHHLIVTLRTSRSRTLQFLAGQYVELRLRGGETCSAAVASCPCNGMYLQFHFSNLEQAFMQQMFSRLRLRDVVEVSGPYGDVTLDDASRRPLVLVAQDTGFAPVKSLLEHALALELAQPILLIWVSAFEDGHYLANLCRSWVDALDNFTYQPLHLLPGSEGAMADVIASAVADATAADFYLATSRRLQTELHTALTAQGAVAERIFILEKGICAT